MNFSLPEDRVNTFKKYLRTAGFQGSCSALENL